MLQEGQKSKTIPSKLKFFIQDLSSIYCYITWKYLKILEQTCSINLTKVTDRISILNKKEENNSLKYFPFAIFQNLASRKRQAISLSSYDPTRLNFIKNSHHEVQA